MGFLKRHKQLNWIIREHLVTAWHSLWSRPTWFCSCEGSHWLIMRNRVWSQADHLIKSYIGSGSTTPVNLPGEIELEIINQHKSGQITNKLFTKAEQAIRDLLRYDSYRRFLKSTPFLWIEVCVGLIHSSPNVAQLVKLLFITSWQALKIVLKTNLNPDYRRQNSLLKSILGTTINDFELDAFRFSPSRP